MCGIAGIYNLNNKPVSSGLLKRMTDILKHRGPDDEGYYINNGIGLGHRRLSIIDLSPAGHQPMCNEDGTVWIVYNGEIYNYVELTSELKSKGHTFKSSTDSEVIIHAYEEYGEDCLHKLNGMFAFAIWDNDKERMFCARDRFGIKPFYYYIDNERFHFASEIKAIILDKTIKRKPNDPIIFDYLAYGLLDHIEDTFFVGIKRLMPGHYMVIQNSKMEIKRWWNLDVSKAPNNINDWECAKRFRELFEGSIKLRLRSDVSIGTCLSGGLDSSSIVCVANDLMSDKSKQKTFSSCFEDEKYDERKFIESVIDKTGAEVNFVFPSGEELFDKLRSVIWHQDEPFGSTSIFAQWNVMRLAKERGVKVLLDGQGGDELLAGYHLYFVSYFADLIKSFQILALIKEMKYYAGHHSYLELFKIIKGGREFLLPDSLKFLLKILLGLHYANWLDRDFVKSHLKRGFSSYSKRGYKKQLDDELYQLLTSTSLPALLRFEDRNSMAFSIEARVPFLDHHLVKFVFSLPASQKIRKGVTKVVLRNAMKGTLPENIRTRMDKMGFVTPEDIWFRTIARDRILDIIDSKSFKKRKYFNVKEIKKDFEVYCDGGKNISTIVWRWVNLELWFREFID